METEQLEKSLFLYSEVSGSIKISVKIQENGMKINYINIGQVGGIKKYVILLTLKKGN